MYYRVGGFKVSRGTLPAGDQGTRTTLDLMKRLAQQGAREVEVQAAAVDIVRQAGVRPHDHMAELMALYRFVRDRVHFVNDPVGVEKLQGPRFTLEHMAGDCDDKATLLSALIMAIGIPARLRYRVVAANPRTRAFSHVYTVANLGGRDIALDPTYQGTPMGAEPAPARRLADFAL